ncbi:MAG: hypothetical protein O7C56_05600 [Rickettsia endosymbiont of Ixodes persulcatus]|nr:hypothetical protein [Rickettsia endosymbiont of Ixodes persulcatus]
MKDEEERESQIEDEKERLSQVKDEQKFSSCINELFDKNGKYMKSVKVLEDSVSRDWPTMKATIDKLCSGKLTNEMYKKALTCTAFSGDIEPTESELIVVNHNFNLTRFY